MKHEESRWRLVADLWSTKALIWIASVGRDVDLKPETHLYLFDRYRRLAQLHRLRGHAARAGELQDKANWHFEASGGNGPPYAAAMAVPRPGRPTTTCAVSGHAGDPDDAA